MGRPAKIKTYVEAKAREKGTLQARVEMERKKPLEVSLREHIGKVIDNTTIKDMAEIMAAVGLTPVIHDLIITVEANLTRATNLFKTVGLNIATMMYQGPLVYSINQILAIIGVLKETPAKVGQDFDIFAWLLSFSIAYVVVSNAGALIGLLGQGLGAVVPMFLGA